MIFDFRSFASQTGCSILVGAADAPPLGGAAQNSQKHQIGETEDFWPWGSM